MIDDAFVSLNAESIKRFIDDAVSKEREACAQEKARAVARTFENIAQFLDRQSYRGAAEAVRSYWKRGR